MRGAQIKAGQIEKRNSRGGDSGGFRAFRGSSGVGWKGRESSLQHAWHLCMPTAYIPTRLRPTALNAFNAGKITIVRPHA